MFGSCLGEFASVVTVSATLREVDEAVPVLPLVVFVLSSLRIGGGYRQVDVNGKINVGIVSNGIRSHYDARCSSSFYCWLSFPLNVSSCRPPASLGVGHARCSES
jgi:hypothetical protein